MGPRDLLQSGAVVVGFAAAGALGFAAGYFVGRDPQLLRRIARVVAGGVERISVAVAESREELADLWAEVSEEAREGVEAQAFASAAASAASADAPVAPSNEPEPASQRPRTQAFKPTKKARPPARKQRGSATRPRSVAPNRS